MPLIVRDVKRVGRLSLIDWAAAENPLEIIIVRTAVKKTLRIWFFISLNLLLKIFLRLDVCGKRIKHIGTTEKVF